MNYLQRKKLAFMSIVNQIKGFVRTVIGIPPLTLPECVDNNSIINYTIGGNSVQIGTPTPETPVEVESVGEKTRNIWYPSVDTVTQNGITATRNSDNTFTVNGTATDVAYLHLGTVSVEVGTVHYLSGGTPNAPLAFQFRQGSSGLGTVFNSGGVSVEDSYLLVDSDTINVVIKVTSGATVNEVVKPMISVENTGDYEPYGKYKIPVVCSDGKGKSVTTNIYLDEPLRKVGTYADTIDFQNRMVVRNVGVAECTPGRTYGVYSLEVYSFYGYFITQDNMKKGTRQAGFCTHIPNTKKENSSLWFGVGNQTIYFSLPDIYNLGSTTVERRKAFQDWLASSEEPFLLYYPLAEPTETAISLPKLPTIKGTTILSVDTQIQPSNMSATYYSTAKE